MKPRDPKSMTVNELWALHTEIKSALASRIAAEKTKLEKQLKQLESDGTLNEIHRTERRPYHGFIQNIKIQPNLRRPGRVAASSHAG
jgi:hypothetical protein